MVKLRLAGMPRLACAAVAAIGLVAMAAGCSSSKSSPGSGTAKAPEVASLATPTANPSASTDTRPRLRLDMTDADMDLMYEPYHKCLSEHGLPDKRTATNQNQAPPREVYEAAEKACAVKQPLPPWELDRTNPEAADFAQRVVRCLRNKGVRYVEVSTKDSPTYDISLGGKDNDKDSISKGLDFMKDCQREAAVKR